MINTLRLRQNGRHFADDCFKYIFMNENICISIKSSLKFVPKGPINNIPALVQIMAWHQPGDKPLFEPMMATIPTHICITQSHWVNGRVHVELWLEHMHPSQQSWYLGGGCPAGMTGVRFLSLPYQPEQSRLMKMLVLCWFTSEHCSHVRVKCNSPISQRFLP